MRMLILSIISLFFISCSSSNSSKQDGQIIYPVFTNDCRYVDKVIYQTPQDTISYLSDTKDMITYWDDRYITSTSMSACTPNLVNSTSVDTTTTLGNIEFGGSQSTLVYRLSNVYPFQSQSNLMMQVRFSTVNYVNLNTNIGGGIYFNLFLVSKLTNERINYVISIYTFGQAWSKEQSGILHDPTTNTHFISTTVDKGNNYSTISDISDIINTPNGFFRVNITHENISNVLTSTIFRDKNPDNWEVQFIGMQFELEEAHGDAVLTGAFSEFSSYTTTEAM